MGAIIKAISYYLPEGILSNAQLAKEFPDWTLEKIQQKTGIRSRHIASKAECASDLGVAACRKLFEMGVCNPADIDFLILCTQSPDYFLPTTACLMQERLDLSMRCGALDFNLGCSGYVYGIGLAKGFLETGQATKVLLVTAETYSKYIHPGDRSVRTLFGDAATATLLCEEKGRPEALGPFVYGTDGRGGKNLIVPAGAMRRPHDMSTGKTIQNDQGNVRSEDNLYMNGPEIFSFTLRTVPTLVEQTLLRAGLSPGDVDFYIFHQANQYMLDSLRTKIGIPGEKFVMSFEDVGNTVSSTIPIALQRLQENGSLQPGHRVMLVGFGVGYSWAAAMVRWA